PLVTACVVTVLGLERVTRGELVSAVIAFVGIVVIATSRGSVEVGEALALALALGAVLCSVVHSVLLKRSTSSTHPLSATAVFLAVTTLVAWVPALAELDELPWPPPLGPTIATVYLAIFGSVVAFVSYVYLLRRVSLMVASSLVLVIPILALLVDAAFERRATIESGTWLGVAITLGALALSFGLKVRAARRPTSG